MGKLLEMRNILLTIILLAAAGCSEDPAIRTTLSYNFGFTNTQGQKMFAGESIDAGFWFNVPVNEKLELDSVRVVFEVTEGGGELSRTTEYIESGETFVSAWTLGHQSFRQVLRASVYDISGTLIAASDLLAYGFREGEWEEVTDHPSKNISSLATDTVRGITFMVAGNDLYRQGDRFYQWTEVNNQLFEYPNFPRGVEIDRNGVFYVSTYSGVIYKSTDHGNTWLACAKPYPQLIKYVSLYISNDNRLWTNVAGHPVRYSDNGGSEWHDAGEYVTAHGAGDVFRMSNGSMVMHGLDCCSAAISADAGQTWIPMNLGVSTQKLFVSDEDEIMICCEVGMSTVIYRTSDMGVTFIPVKNIVPGFRTTMDNTFMKWEDYYYVTIPGYGIMKSYNLTDFEVYWQNQEIVNLFIDHSGVLIAKKGWVGSVFYMWSDGQD